MKVQLRTGAPGGDAIESMLGSLDERERARLGKKIEECVRGCPDGGPNGLLLMRMRGNYLFLAFEPESDTVFILTPDQIRITLAAGFTGAGTCVSG